MGCKKSKPTHEEHEEENETPQEEETVEITADEEDTQEPEEEKKPEDSQAETQATETEEQTTLGDIADSQNPESNRDEQAAEIPEGDVARPEDQVDTMEEEEEEEEKLVEQEEKPEDLEVKSDEGEDGNIERVSSREKESKQGKSHERKEGIAYSKPGVWALDDQKGWIACLAVPEKSFIRPVVATWFEWKPSQWTEDEWKSNLSGTHPNTATKEQHGVYKIDAPKPTNRLLKKISQKCDVGVHVSDITRSSKHGEIRFYSFHAASRHSVEKACNAFMEYIPRDDRIHISVGGNRYGQMYDDTLDPENQKRRLKTTAQWRTYFNTRDAIFYTEKESRILRQTMDVTFGEFAMPQYTRAM